MSWLPNPIACDVCGVIKQPSNHWYYAEIRPDTPEEDNAVFTIWPWDYPAEDRSKPYIHLCGQACAARKLNEFLSPSQPPNKPEPCTQAVIQPPENEEPAQPQWTEGGSIKGNE